VLAHFLPLHLYSSMPSSICLLLQLLPKLLQLLLLLQQFQLLPLPLISIGIQ
jgi:hypothetical protein